MPVDTDWTNAIATGDVDALADYWHEDLVFEAPFSFTGTPSRTEGKQAVHDRLSGSYGLVTMAFTITEVYELVDPDRRRGPFTRHSPAPLGTCRAVPS